LIKELAVSCFNFGIDSKVDTSRGSACSEEALTAFAFAHLRKF